MLIRGAELAGRFADVRLADGHIAAIAPHLAGIVGEATIDAGGGALLPGLHDHHIHLNATAAAMASLRCGPPEVTSREALAAALTAAGFRITAFVAYRAEALERLPPAVGRDLAEHRLEAALHYSRRSAAVALALADGSEHGGAFRRLRHYCLSPDVAAPLEAAGVPVHFVAARPREADLLDALARRPG